MKTLSLRKLKLLGACTQQVELFHRLFGDRCIVSVELCVAHAAQFDWSWAAQRLLSVTAYKAYYEAVAPAYKARDEAVAPACKAYDEAVAPARKARDEAKARAFAIAFLNS